MVTVYRSGQKVRKFASGIGKILLPLGREFGKAAGKIFLHNRVTVPVGRLILLS
jgi:hypothetical protein